jgi:hypothetical protein
MQTVFEFKRKNRKKFKLFYGYTFLRANFKTLKLQTVLKFVIRMGLYQLKREHKLVLFFRIFNGKMSRIADWWKNIFNWLKIKK